MDKYEYKLKTEEMLELMEDGEYRKAAAAADLIDWKRVRNAGMLMNVSDIYEKTKEYQKSYDVMNLAYRRSEGSRKVIYKLCSLAIKMKQSTIMTNLSRLHRKIRTGISLDIRS